MMTIMVIILELVLPGCPRSQTALPPHRLQPNNLHHHHCHHHHHQHLHHQQCFNLRAGVNKKFFLGTLSQTSDPPTAQVWDSTKWKIKVKFILLFRLFRAFYFFEKREEFFGQSFMYLFGTLDPHPPTATPILGQGPKKRVFAEWLFSLEGLGLWTPTYP